MRDMITIGGGSAFFIDSATAVPQLLDARVDYIIFDYLAEGAMGLMGRMRAADAESGFTGDFLDVHVGPFLQRIADGGPKIVANAGGVNPEGLARAVRARIAEMGLSLKVSAIGGDDLSGRTDELSGVKDMFSGKPLNFDGMTSCTAYLGAFPIAEALAQGADIVITGRVVDSALALGALVHEFGWQSDEFDKLAAGTVIGHLIECGAQVTGGTFTDWREVSGWANIGAPIAECMPDGSCVLTKPEGTGGLVNRGTVAEQMLYEVGDPQAYLVPDVAVDFSTVVLEEDGENRVRVTGATGRPAPATLKACLTRDEGWRAVAYQPVIGADARAKAEKQSAALFDRVNGMLRGQGKDAFSRTEAVYLGSDEEVVMKLVVEHAEPIGPQIFAREQFAAISAMAPGTSVAFGVQVVPMMELMCFLVPRENVTATIDGTPFDDPRDAAFDPGSVERPAVPGPDAEPKRSVPLEALAWARSGEKGETINIGVIARDAEDLPWLRAALTESALRERLPDLGAFSVTVYDLPGTHSLNVVLDGALPGGINASQRLDPAAKSIAQRLVRMKVPVG